jgi:hypothetical protein
MPSWQSTGFGACPMWRRTSSLVYTSWPMANIPRVAVAAAQRRLRPKAEGTRGDPSTFREDRPLASALICKNPNNIIDLGDIGVAPRTEMMMPLWMRLFQGVIGHPHFDYQIVRGH